MGERRDGRGFRIFESGARERAVAYAKKRMGAGVKAGQVSNELGLIGWTLQRWLQRDGRGELATASENFVRLEVKAQPQQGAVVRGACGVWVEGLEIEGIAALLRRLSCLG